ncbi:MULTISPECIES: choice-of-anchor V domain-containing protein [Ignavibacterium]|jgi:hypothetical protein|uniref:choice-of-anchor V domain-containing protein n=1 Tax=Ignavibacterium TaxID=795750 RepID=UPI0025C4C65A|nr:MULTISPECIES: choice-of-anchor V domain-containing protein [Ignavibacterium]MBI5662074.1 T9SS type A sorting domain-containing protein [Ignavibacterium album]
MKTTVLLAIIFFSVLIYAFGVHYPTGIVGLTEKDGAIGCLCHNFEKSDSVLVWIEGPDSLVIGSSAEYKLFLFGGPAIKGGFNAATLEGKLYPIDTLTQRMVYVEGDTQLTHTQPLNFDGDTIFWKFIYEAPDSETIDTIYSVANSVDGDGNPNDTDKWNFGRKFTITIYDSPISVEPDNINADVFALNQNYPNPFNPSTNFSWQSSIPGKTTLKLYDIKGNEIETIVSGFYEPGFYSVSYIANSSMTSGVYLLKLSVGSYSQVKKIVLMK